LFAETAKKIGDAVSDPLLNHTIGNPVRCCIPADDMGLKRASYFICQRWHSYKIDKEKSIYHAKLYGIPPYRLPNATRDLDF
jgi:hypothetical protein